MLIKFWIKARKKIVSKNKSRDSNFRFSDDHGMPLFETSAKDDSKADHVEAIFLTLAHKVRNNKTLFKSGKIKLLFWFWHVYTSWWSENATMSRASILILLLMKHTCSRNIKLATQTVQKSYNRHIHISKSFSRRISFAKYFLFWLTIKKITKSLIFFRSASFWRGIWEWEKRSSCDPSKRIFERAWTFLLLFLVLPYCRNVVFFKGIFLEAAFKSL